MPARRIALFLILALSLSSFAAPFGATFAQDNKKKTEREKKSAEEKLKSVYKTSVIK